MSEPATSSAPPKKSRNRFFHGRFLFISIAFHVLLAVVATYLVVQSLAPRKQTFKAGAPPGNPAQKAVEHQVQLAQKQKSMSAPAPAKKITTTGLAKVVLPEMPEMPTVSMPNKMQTMGATGLGFGTGTGKGGAGGGTGAGKSIPFFGAKEKGAGLQGTLYDLKQTPNRQKTDVSNDDYSTTLQEFVKKDMRASQLSRFFKSPRPIYAPQIFIPVLDAEEAPKAFGLQNLVKAERWVILYEGRVRAPETGTFRFVGFADDIMVVRLDGKMVLDASLHNVTGWEDKKSYKYSEAGPKRDNKRGDIKLKAGEWFKVRAGQTLDLQILLGEKPGGWFYAMLMLEEEGANYRKTKEGSPILPIFRVADVDPPRLKSSDGAVEFDKKGDKPWPLVDNTSSDKKPK
jgi:hypothetical protein